MRALALVDGQIVAADQVQIPISDPAFAVGWAVFETLRSNAECRAVRLDEHLDRLARSAELAAIPMPPPSLIASASDSSSISENIRVPGPDSKPLPALPRTSLSIRRKKYASNAAAAVSMSAVCSLSGLTDSRCISAS